MKNKMFTLNVCYCKENIKNIMVGSIFDENKSHNCLNCGHYQNYKEVSIEIDENKKVIWSTIQ